mgnify:CR=1 FL=1
MKQSPYQLLMGVVLLGTVAFLSWQAGGLAAAGMQYIQSENGPGEQKQAVVVIDPGHGGTDPGKVGIDGQLEKDINLAVAKKLKTYLEASDVKVVLTRDVDTGLYSSKDTHKKMADMKKRCQLIEEAKPDLVISIHQNSYPEEYVHGAQVFYYNGSSGGEQLAGLIQTQLVQDLDPENHRQIKPNDSYYLLKKTKGTIVIVECGFLSNAAEAGKLCDEAYQDRVAWSIHKGILQYINGIQRD